MLGCQHNIGTFVGHQLWNPKWNKMWHMGHVEIHQTAQILYWCVSCDVRCCTTNLATWLLPWGLTTHGWLVWALCSFTTWHSNTGTSYKCSGFLKYWHLLFYQLQFGSSWSCLYQHVSHDCRMLPAHVELIPVLLDSSHRWQRCHVVHLIICPVNINWVFLMESYLVCNGQNTPMIYS